MPKKTWWTVLLCGLPLTLLAQSETNTTKSYRAFPIVVSLQFHSFAMPFRDLKTNFRNVGIGLGTEISLNGKHNLAQQLSAVWYHNKHVGNGLFFYTQTAWRPTVVGNMFTELKLGGGYLISYRPVESYKQIDGNWISAGHKGKGMFTIPIGISVGYNKYSQNTYIAPFASYQFLLVTGYNKSIPLVPETLIQLGSRIHLK